MSFLEMSLMGSAMILCILLLRTVTRGRLPAAVLSVMWAAAILRLLMPVAIPSPLSMMSLVKQIGRPTVITLSAQPITNSVSLSPLVFVWLCGVMLCILFFLLVDLRQRHALQAVLPAKMTPKLKAALSAQHLSRPAAVYTSDRISTPLTYGLINPRIVLPSHMALNSDELNFVIAHECGHIIRRDIAKKCILLASVCLHWFNPLVWLMAAVCRRDMELDCDRYVLKAYGPKERKAYAQALLGLEERKRFSGILMECFSRSPLEERIHSIMTGKKTTLVGVLPAVMVFGCFAAVFATSPGAQTSIAVSTVSIASTPAALYDVRQAQVSEATVYVWNGEALAIEQPSLELAMPAIMVSERLSDKTHAEISGSVSLTYGSAMAAATEKSSVPAAPLPVYSITYTIKEMDTQH